MASSKSKSIRDRTLEFQNIAERVKKPQDVAASSGSLPSTRAAIQQKSEFVKKASEIGLGIHKTSLKLQKLAQLAKRTSMFDDPAKEISEITGIIKQDIQQLNTSIVALQRLTSGGSSVSGQEVKHSKTVVDNLRTRLKDTTQEFKDVLTIRSENLKDQNQRRQIFSSVPENGLHENSTGESTSAREMFGAKVSTLRLHKLTTVQGDEQNGSGALVSESCVLNTSYDPYPQSSLAIRGRASLNAGQQMQMMQGQDTYLANRAEAMQNVESTIVELGGIFQQLAHMVKEQGEMAIRIDENLSETFENVESAQGQLLKYLNSISSNRWLIAKIFFILMIFLVVFVVFLA